MVINPVVLFIALDCEARIFIDLFRLKKEAQFGLFKIFSSDQIKLVITGIGKENSLIAMGLFKGLYPHFQGPIINFGIAGHQNFPIGNLFQIHHLINSTENKSFFLNPKSHPLFPFFPLKTLESPQDQYEKQFLFDMEGFWFVQAGLNFYTIEQLHVLKIISDNEEHSFHTLNKETILRICLSKKQQLISYFQLLEKVNEDPTLNELKSLEKKMRLTETQKHTLKRLLERAHALKVTIDIESSLSYERFTTDLKTKIENSLSL
ncbi:MAG: hypothetical protein EBU93_02330 [Chlamydiae bacterium]|nr:hypothetical protein [Chlamydiota bacterium]